MGKIKLKSRIPAARVLVVDVGPKGKKREKKKKDRSRHKIGSQAPISITMNPDTSGTHRHKLNNTSNTVQIKPKSGIPGFDQRLDHELLAIDVQGLH